LWINKPLNNSKTNSFGLRRFYVVVIVIGLAAKHISSIEIIER
jgi:hypothetical protein